MTFAIVTYTIITFLVGLMFSSKEVFTVGMPPNIRHRFYGTDSYDASSSGLYVTILVISGLMLLLLFMTWLSAVGETKSLFHPVALTITIWAILVYPISWIANNVLMYSLANRLEEHNREYMKEMLVYAEGIPHHAMVPIIAIGLWFPASLPVAMAIRKIGMMQRGDDRPFIVKLLDSRRKK